MIVTMEGLFYDCTVLFDFLRVVVAINGEVANIWFLAFFFCHVHTQKYEPVLHLRMC